MTSRGVVPYSSSIDIPCVDLGRFDLSNYYAEEQIQDISEDLKRKRLEWLSQFHRLDKDVIATLRP